MQHATAIKELQVLNIISSMTENNSKTGKQQQKQAKLARMQAALRENLKRRKEQQRGRVTVKQQDKEDQSE